MYVYRLVSYAGIILGISVRVKHQVECLDFITPMHTRVDRAGADQGRESWVVLGRMPPCRSPPRTLCTIHAQTTAHYACHISLHSMHAPPLLQSSDQPLLGV